MPPAAHLPYRKVPCWLGTTPLGTCGWAGVGSTEASSHGSSWHHNEQRFGARAMPCCATPAMHRHYPTPPPTNDQGDPR